MTRSQSVFSAFTCLLGLHAADAFAESAVDGPALDVPAAPTATADATVRTASVTLSALRLLTSSGLLEVTVEADLGEKFSVAGIFGGGGQFQTLGGGVQGIYRVFGDFDDCFKAGMQVVYLVKPDTYGLSGNFEQTRDGWNVGPYLGAKATSDLGFTFEFDFGLQVAEHKYVLSDGSGVVETGYSLGTAPMMNLQLGWSF